MTTNFGGLDVVPLRGTIVGCHCRHRLSVTLLSTVITQKLVYAIWGLGCIIFSTVASVTIGARPSMLLALNLFYVAKADLGFQPCGPEPCVLNSPGVNVGSNPKAYLGCCHQPPNACQDCISNKSNQGSSAAMH